MLYHERAHDQLRKIEARQPIPPALRFLLGFTQAYPFVDADGIEQ
jgi:hypothetical protein